ncbi:hypothetical protein NQZ79_g8717 [Umbelopsis isabellina]|nr:hypothetical protein NQZ79_g8717 [Umbelopsis isabellina]
MSDSENQDQQQRLKSAVWYTVGRIAEVEGIRHARFSKGVYFAGKVINTESCIAENTGKTASPQFIASLADVVYKQMGN